LQQRLDRLRSPISEKAALTASSDATALRAPAYMQQPAMPITCKPAAPVHDIEAEIDALLSTGTPVAPKAKANALRKGKKAKPVMAKSPASAAGLTVSDEALIAAFVAQDQRAIAAGEATSSPPALKGFALCQAMKKATPPARRAATATAVGVEMSSAEADAVVAPAKGAASGCGNELLMFSPELLASVQAQLRQPCDVDACASDGGGNALLPKYYSPGNSFLSADLGSTTSMLWLHPPVKG
jgi:hypothetical protein